MKQNPPGIETNIMRPRPYSRHQCLLPLFMLAISLCAGLTGSASLAQRLDAKRISPAPPVLQLRTYDDNWLRYDNVDGAGGPKLAVDGVTQFPFRHVRSVFPQGIAELESAAATLLLDEKYDLQYDEDEIVGYCDSEKLSHKSTDLICAPGPCDMSEGYVFLALYHPDTSALVALTTTIDNFEGAAVRKSSCPTAQPVSEFNGNAEGYSEAQGCGPYVPGQWIKSADYAASGLSLPIVMHELAGDLITDYQCVAREVEASYLLAYSLYYNSSIEAGRAGEIDGMEPLGSRYGVWCLICGGIEESGFVFEGDEMREVTKKRCEEERDRRGGDCECKLIPVD